MSQINLTWTAAIPQPGTSIAKYIIYRNDSGNWPPIGTSVVPSFSDGNVLDSTTYSYYVVAIDSRGAVSSQSNVVSVTTPGAPPAVPTGLAVVGTTTTSISLSWNPSSASFNLYRNGSFLANTTSSSYIDTGLTASTTYAYTIQAVDAVGNTSAQSSPVNGTTKSASTNSMKWFPGWWMGSDAVLTNGRAWNDTHFTSEYSDLDTSSSATIGYRMFVTFAHIDPNNANGADANYHWADIDAVLARIAPRKFAIQYNLGVFNNATPARPNGSTDTIPSYMLNNTATYGPGFPSGDPTGQGGYYEQQTGGYCANITNANVLAQVIKSIQAMARRYDGHPQFGFIGLCEDSNMIPLSSTGLSGQFRAAWMSVYQAMRTAFTQTPTYAQATFQFDGQQSETVCEDMVARGVLQGTADTYGARYIGGIFTGSISGTTLTVTAVSNGTIYTNRGIDDLTGNLAAGQRIVSQLSGTTGGVGTYQVSISQTVASESMYGVITASPPYNGMQWGFNCFTGTPFSVGGTPVTGILDRRPQSRAIVDVQDSSADQVRTQNVADLALALNLGWDAAVCFFSHITGRTGSAAWANWNTAEPLFASNPLTNNSYPANLP